MRTLLVTVLFAAAATVQAQEPPRKTGVLLLAHGGGPDWNARVMDLVSDLSSAHPVEVAFGMASRGAIEEALVRLASLGVSDIVAVPLFVSSWSSVIRSTEFLLGLRREAPADLALFARLDHAGHSGAQCVAPCDPTAPIPLPATVRMTAALNRHPLVGAILADRARSLSVSPHDEAVVLVAHGPSTDEDNRLWLADMASLAEHVRASSAFAAVHALTVRDDASTDVRADATRELRRLVERETRAGRRVLIVPHLLSFGGIERGIRTRLDGLDYAMADQALMPDPRLSAWVLAQVAGR